MNGLLTIAVEWLRQHFLYVAGVSASAGTTIVLVPIGTLLSVTSAVAIGQLIKRLLL